MMRYGLHLYLAALSICAFTGTAAVAAPGESPGQPGMERMQHWAADHEAMLDAKLAGLKAGLKLTADQEKLWPPFETTVRAAAKMRAEHMEARMERMQKMREMMKEEGGPNEMTDMGSMVSPVERLEALAQRMSEHATVIKNIADAAKPFYASLDDSQKRLFSLLGEGMLMMGQGHRRGGMMGRMGMGMMGGPGLVMGESGMGIMGGESNTMKMMGNPSNDDEDTSEDE